MQAFKKHEIKQPTMGLGNVGNFMKQYDDMQKWYCGDAANKAKAMCVTFATGKGLGKGVHPLWQPKHAQHAEWVAMSKGWCDLPENKGGKKLVCAIQRMGKYTGAGTGRPNMALPGLGR